MKYTTDSIAGSKQDDILMTGACVATLTTLIPVTLYQIGVLSSLPDPPTAIFDSEKITSSKAAHPLGIPDGVLGLASFGTTLALIIAARRSSLAKQLLGTKLTLDVAAGAFNASRQIIGFRKLCSWCTATAIAAAVMGYAGRGLIRETWSKAAVDPRGKQVASKKVRNG